MVLITSFSIMLGDSTLNFPFLSENLHQPCSSQLLKSKQVVISVQCHAAPWLEAVPYTSWTTHWDFYPGLQLSPVSLKPKSSVSYCFLIFCCYFCPGSDGAPQSCGDSYFPYTSCGNEGMSAECLALTLTDLTLLPGRCPNVTKMNHMGSPST